MNAKQQKLARARYLTGWIREQQGKRDANVFIPQTPTPRQQAFLSLDCLEALYGGAAGGGKSSALLMAALQHVHVPGYAALVLRRTYRDLSLPGAIMDRSHEWLRGKAKWNDVDKRWTFPSGATLTFGYLDAEKDKYRYQGAELQFIGFDELTQFPEQSYRYLLSRLRRLQGVGVPIRARAASNPGGIGHDWVRRRLVDGATSGRAFVPATLADNPYLDAVAYRQSLAQLDETTRRQLEHGIWVRDSGGLVYRFDESRNTAAQAPRCDHYLLGMDFGVRDATAFVVLGWREHDPSVYALEAFKREGMSPSDAGEEAQRLSERYKFVRVVGDVGGLGKAFAEEMRRRFSIPVEPAEKHNKLGYISLMNGDLERGRIKVQLGTCDELVSEWLELPWTEGRDKEADGFDNHAADACLYAWRATNAFHEAPKPAPPTHDEHLRRLEERLMEQAEEEVQAAAARHWWEA